MLCLILKTRCVVVLNDRSRTRHWLLAIVIDCVVSCRVMLLCCVVLCCVVSCVLCCVVLCCRLSCCAELRCVVLEHTEF